MQGKFCRHHYCFAAGPRNTNSNALLSSPRSFQGLFGELEAGGVERFGASGAALEPLDFDTRADIRGWDGDIDTMEEDLSGR